MFYVKLCKVNPENLEVLQTLQSNGMRCAILSNGSPDMLHSAVSSAGMTGLIDKVLSVDEVRQFKTSPQSYGLVTDSLSPSHFFFSKR